MEVEPNNWVIVIPKMKGHLNEKSLVIFQK